MNHLERPKLIQKEAALTRCRNIVALLLALLLAPSSVLAALPMVWCVGNDGHRAVEFAIGGNKHVEHRPLGQDPTVDVASDAHEDVGDCFDRQLTDKSKISNAANSGLIPLTLRAVVLLLWPSHDASRDVPLANFRERTRASPDPLRVTRQSVVLLI